MKVVLFCGGQGLRMREYSETIPKPMVSIGYRPILWYLMKYYAHFGHKDFILCLGYKGNVIKEYFLNYQECLSNDFELSNGGSEIKLARTDIQDWKISFVETGLRSNIGQRLKAVEKYLDGEEIFMANYADGLTNVSLSRFLDFFLAKGKIGSFLLVHPASTFHVVKMGDNGLVSEISDVKDSNLWVNGGFFIFRREIFDYIRPGEDLVKEPLQRLIAKGELVAYKNTAFWACMDTFKEKQQFDELYESGNTPWELWNPCVKVNEGGEIDA
jgi:glucose-1-phosphate cytidylyltransferase